MKYKVHYPYYCPVRNINYEIGVYEEAELDLVTARRLTMISPANLDVEVKVEPVKELRVEQTTINADPLGMQELNLEASVNQVKFVKLKINSASEKDIADVKYVSKKNAADVIEERAKSRFTSYEDLDKRVPLAFKRKWQDLTLVDFELLTELSNTELLTVYE